MPCALLTRRIVAMSTFRIALIAAATAALSVPAAADAAVSCEFDEAQHRIDVSLTTSGDYATITRSGNQIRVDDVVCLDGGVIATVNNTNRVVTTDTSGGGTTVGILTWTGAFAPGHADEGDGDSEVEFEINAGGGTDTLQLVGGAVGDSWHAGAVPGGSGVNMNAGAEPGNGADIDVTTSSIERLTAAPGDGDDIVSAAGLAPFSGPLPVSAALDGGDHDDILVGGNVDDELVGGTGDDAMGGGNGPDELRGRSGKDYIDGDGGVDEADYEHASGAVKVDLRIDDAYQDTGSDGSDLVKEIENLAGTAQGDTLIGDEAENVLTARNGDDVIEGGGADDFVHGGQGSDTGSFASAPGGVKVDLRQAFQETGSAGVDTFQQIENATGSAFGDSLTGNGLANVLDGGAGADQLVAFANADTLRVRDGEGDSADCGDGADAVQTDAPGVDTLSACETVDALALPEVAQPPQDQQPQDQQPGPTQPSGDPVAPRDATAPRITLLRRRGGRLTMRVSEKARLSTVIVRDRGRNAKPRFRKVRSLTRNGVAGTNRIRIPRGLKPGRYRAVVVATDAAGNRSAKRYVAFRVSR